MAQIVFEQSQPRRRRRRRRNRGQNQGWNQGRNQQWQNQRGQNQNYPMVLPQGQYPQQWQYQPPCQCPAQQPHGRRSRFDRDPNRDLVEDALAPAVGTIAEVATVFLCKAVFFLLICSSGLTIGIIVGILAAIGGSASDRPGRRR